MDKSSLETTSDLSTKQALRQKAETLVSGNVALSKESLAALSPTIVLKMLHELQVHQIELELQNEELRRAQLQLEALQARYFDLYDLAPISYCTVSEQGIILEANLATAELLGVVRHKLVGQRISRYINKEFQDTYYLCRKLLLKTGVKQSCELHMVKANETSGVEDTAFWVKIALVSAKDSNGETVLRMVLTDITDAKVMAMAMRASESRLRTLVDSHA